MDGIIPYEVQHEPIINSAVFFSLRIMQSDEESLDMEDHYKKTYQENMDILRQINVVSVHLFRPTSIVSYLWNKCIVPGRQTSVGDRNVRGPKCPQKI